ncbi:transcription factor LBX2-like isoform X2 [Glandiceps talaboti]
MPEHKRRKQTSRTTEDGAPDPVEHLSKVRLPPPAAPNKPLTPFSIQDILKSNPSRNPRRVNDGTFPNSDSVSARHVHPGRVDFDDRLGGHTKNLNSGSHNPLNALEELTKDTFKGLEENIIKTAEAASDGRRTHLNVFSHRQNVRRKRKSRTAFSNHQLFELERRFMYQKYLSPGDRDEIASTLGLTSSQVITWFQNRRAKLKRDMEEMRNDLSASKNFPEVSGTSLEEEEEEEEGDDEDEELDESRTQHFECDDDRNIDKL